MEALPTSLTARPPSANSVRRDSSNVPSTSPRHGEASRSNSSHVGEWPTSQKSEQDYETAMLVLSDALEFILQQPGTCSLASANP